MKLGFLGAALATLLTASAALAADYPDKQVTIVVGASAGGGADIQARILAEGLSEKLGQQVLVDNRPGAGSNIASAYVAGTNPDGYTLTLIAPSAAINSTLYVTPGYDALTDFVPVAGWASAPLLFVVNPELPVSSLQELADYSLAHPGELDYGNGVGFPNQMVMELFKLETGADIQFIPYQGMAPARTDVVGGQIEATVDTVASSGPFVSEGQLKALAVTTAERLPQFPDIPTVAEAGYPSVARNTWYGLLAPAGTPQEIVDRLASDIAAIQADPETVAKIESSGGTPMISGPADFAAFFTSEVETWGDVINKAGLQKVE